MILQINFFGVVDVWRSSLTFFVLEGGPGGINAAGPAEGKCKNPVKQCAQDDLTDW